MLEVSKLRCNASAFDPLHCWYWRQNRSCTIAAIGEGAAAPLCLTGERTFSQRILMPSSACDLAPILAAKLACDAEFYSMITYHCV